MTDDCFLGRYCCAAVPHRIDRQHDGELAALPRRAVNRNLAAVGGYDMAHQRQSESTSFRVVHQRITDAIELLKNLLLLLLRNPYALIHYFQLHRAVVAI